MDVRCPACSVEYEFDDDKVTPQGVTVKCTNCTHIFKVRREAAQQDAQVVTETVEWMIRTRDGRSLRFKELTTLQKWIVEQKVGRTDEISKTGKSWKALADIAELSSFFQVVDAANQARLIGQGTPQPTPVTVPEQPAPAIGPSGKPTLETFFDGHTFDDLDVEDPVKQWKRRGTLKRAAAVLLLLGVGAGAGLYFLRPDLVQPWIARLQGHTPAGDQALQLVHSALPRDDLGEIDTLLSEVGDKTDDQAADATLLAAVSRLHAARARQLGEVGRLEKTPDAQKAAETARDEALQRAYQFAVRALSAPGDKNAAHLAHADYQSLKGAATELEADLGQALAGTPPADFQKEADIIRTLALARRTVIDPDPARQKKTAAAFELALGKAQARTFKDARLEYAKLAIDKLVGHDNQSAVQGFAAAHPRHRPASLLAAEAPPAAAPPGETADEDGDDEDDESNDAEDDAEEKRTGRKLDYHALLKKADRLRLADHSSASVKYYKRAMRKKPTSHRPHIGLGWAYLDMDRLSSSTASFKKALKLNGKAAEAHLGLGEVYRARGDKAQAIKSFQAFLKLQPSGRDADQARRAIKSLK